MNPLGTPYSAHATRLLLLGSGELAKECAIEAQRLGVEVVAVDRYDHAPAMPVSHRSHVLDMTDAEALRALLLAERPFAIIPEIEAVNTDVLLELEQAGMRIVPGARAVQRSMHRLRMREWAAEAGLPTTDYASADSLLACYDQVQRLGLPCVFKPMQSSSGKGQTVVRSLDEVEPAWMRAQQADYATEPHVLIERWMAFEYEITLLAVRQPSGVDFCAPIGHYQEHGDYRESWQPHPMPAVLLRRAQELARTVVDGLGGYGLFAVELFVEGDDIRFNEAAARPHDTGLVTLVSQNLSEFALHVRAALGLPIPAIRQLGPSASAALHVAGHGEAPRFHGLHEALHEPDTHLRLFGKPNVQGARRLGVALAQASDLAGARARARQVLSRLRVEWDPPAP